MKREGQEAKAESKILAKCRRRLLDEMPGFVEELIKIAHKPERNSQTKLAAIRDGMDRVGLVKLAATQITTETSDGQSVTLNVNFLPPKKEDE